MTLSAATFAVKIVLRLKKLIGILLLIALAVAIAQSRFTSSRRSIRLGPTTVHLQELERLMVMQSRQVFLLEAQKLTSPDDRTPSKYCSWYVPYDAYYFVDMKAASISSRDPKTKLVTVRIPDIQVDVGLIPGGHIVIDPPDTSDRLGEAANRVWRKHAKAAAGLAAMEESPVAQARQYAEQAIHNLFEPFGWIAVIEWDTTVGTK